MSTNNSAVIKEIKLNAKPRQFFVEEALAALQKQEAGEMLTESDFELIKTQTKLVIDGFGVESIDDDIELSLKMEDFIFDLFQLLPEPTAPLRKATHQKYIMSIAQQLSSTIDSPDSMICLADEDLNKVKKFIDNDEEFEKLQVKFQYVKKSDNSAAAIPLNPKLLGMSPGFIHTLSVLFKQ
jgi:hypothetical protein